MICTMFPFRKLFRTTHFWFMALAAAVPGLIALEKPVETLSLGAPLPLQLTVQRTLSDGMPIDYAKLQAGEFSMNWFASDVNWRKASQPVPGSSLAFVDVRFPELQMEFMLYQKGRVKAGSLDREWLSRYLATLQGGLAPDMIAVLNPDNFLAPSGSVPFLNQRYRVIHLEVVPENAEAPVYRMSDFLTLTEDGYLFVVRFRGPSEVMERLQPTMPRSLARFVR